MKKGDTQLAAPEIEYTDTKANIEALSGVVIGARAYATDTKDPGWYDGSVWVWGAGGGGGDADAIHDNVDGEINAITEKVTPANNDLLLIEDSAASYAKKKVKISNLPAGTGSVPPALKVILNQNFI